MIKIPLSVKMSYYFSNLAGMITQLSHCNIAGLVLSNCSYSPDIDIEKLEVNSACVLSSPVIFLFPCGGLPYGQPG
jgi:dihydroorotate dehydrogenase (fumarate)